MRPTISVAMCTFNGERYISEQVDSILSQTWVDFELLIFDDASTDATPTILYEYALHDSRIKFSRNTDRLGYNGNFARALGAARGDYIAPADQDDIWHPEKLQRLKTNLTSEDLIYCDSQYVDSNGAPLGVCMSSLRRMYSGQNPLAFVFTNCISGHSMLIRSDLAKSSLPPPPGIYYDWWLAISAANAGGVRYFDEPLVKFRRHHATATTLGGIRRSRLPSSKEYLSERLSILKELAGLTGAHRKQALKLHAELERWLQGGSRLPFFWHCLLNGRSLFYIMSARPGAFLRGAVRNTLTAPRDGKS